ncbi:MULTISPECIES: hypothetical protein [Peribacillus]|uniref:hypothetical protein n=1 Tax=Peribacillus frigoritolerans TaxID=450367 RepID=UPI003DA17630
MIAGNITAPLAEENPLIDITPPTVIVGNGEMHVTHIIKGRRYPSYHLNDRNVIHKTIKPPYRF